MLPQRGNVIIVPAELLSEWARETMRCVDSLRIGIVIAQHRKDGAANVLLKKLVDA